MKFILCLILIATTTVAFASQPATMVYHGEPGFSVFGKSYTVTVTAGDEDVMVLKKQSRESDSILVVPAHTSFTFNEFGWNCYRLVDKQFRVIANGCYNNG